MVQKNRKPATFSNNSNKIWFTIHIFGTSTVSLHIAPVMGNHIWTFDLCKIYDPR